MQLQKFSKYSSSTINYYVPVVWDCLEVLSVLHFLTANCCFIVGSSQRIADQIMLRQGNRLYFEHWSAELMLVQSSSKYRRSNSWNPLHLKRVKIASHFRLLKQTLRDHNRFHVLGGSVSPLLSAETRWKRLWSRTAWFNSFKYRYSIMAKRELQELEKVLHFCSRLHRIQLNSFWQGSLYFWIIK